MAFDTFSTLRTRGAALLAGVSVAAIGVGGVAIAQDEGEGAQRDRIRVTALKREQDESDVPVSITTFSTEDLINTRGRTLEGLEQLTPNFSFEGSGTFPALTIRGVGAGGRNVGFSTRVGAYLDGVYVGQPPALPLPLLDVERIEVLRGPQGNLYGRNTVSGAVNVITKLPGSEPEARAQVGFGNFNLFEAQGYVGGPIVDRVLYAGLSAGYESRDGFYDNVFDGSDVEDLERTAVRGTVSFDATEGLSFTFRGDYSETLTSNVVGQTLEPVLAGVIGPVVPFEDRPIRTVSVNTAPENNTEIWGASLTSEYETANGWTFKSITAQRNSQQLRINDLDYSELDIISLRYDDEFDQFTQELQILSPDTDRFRFIVGAYYFDETADSNRTVPVGPDASLPLVPVAPGVLIGIGDALGLAPGTSTDAVATVETESLAGFFSADFDVTDRWTVTGGARYTVDEKNVDFAIDGTNSGAFMIVTPDDLVDFLGFPEGRIIDDLDEEEVTWSVSSVFSVTDDVNLFGRVATGFKSGGWNIDFLNAGQVALGIDFDPETMISYEAGVKGFLLGDAVRFDLTGFFSEFDEFQINQFVELAPGVTVINLTNAAEVETAGFEASFDTNVTDNFVLGANVGYLTTEFVSYQATLPLPGGGGAGADFSGNELPNAPEWSGAIFANYTVPVSALGGQFDIYGEYSYQDESFSDADNGRLLDARNLVNARLSYKPNNMFWEIGVWGNNVFDEDYVEADFNDFFNNRTQRYGPPATYGADLSIKF